MIHFVAGHFAMTTDTGALLSPNPPGPIRQSKFNKAFPPESFDIVVVVDGQTPELSEDAAARLTASLGAQTKLFHSVQRLDGGPFWSHNGLLFASTEDVKTFISQLVKGQPFLGAMASDPSLRGLANTLALAAKGVNNGDASPQDLRTPIRTLADALQGLSAGKLTFFSWRTLISGKEADRKELRHIIVIDPVLDYPRLQPGNLPIATIRSTAQRLQLDTAHGVRVRL